ncbi:Thiolase, N-terminal domain-containing protein [Syncephalis fuscata]|nr:Thiolase, N-terminal domain-containing protein [Syncephalis fuscata]
MIRRVVIAGAARTPVGSFRGSLAKVAAPHLGGFAIRGALERAGIKADQVEEVYMGNVLQAGLGQSPARQAAFAAGCPDTTEATTINKVCASGMKAITLAAQGIQVGTRDIMVAGGMESMSNTPFYVPRGVEYGNQTMADGIIKDGLWDVYNQIHMGNCAEETAAKYQISRETQDEHAISSYKRATEAWKQGAFEAEIAPVHIRGRKGDEIVTEDEEYKRVRFDKITTLRPVFQSQGGTVTAANASTLNDGASAVVLMAEDKAQELSINPLAEIISYADAACAPKDFTIAPSKAVPIALARANLKIDDISRFEFNEAFSVVARVNEQILSLDPAKVNALGGAVALGHPIGSSGCRIVVTLAHQLEKGQYGCAAVCNGGGAATAIIIRRL